MTLHGMDCTGACVVRKMKVMEEKSKVAVAATALMVTQIHLTSWREQCLPHHSAVLSVIEHMDKVQRSSSRQPTVVMCRLGIKSIRKCMYIKCQCSIYDIIHYIFVLKQTVFVGK